MAWVYILDTESSKYYIGSTLDLSKRLKDHIAGHTPSVKALHFKGCVLYQKYNTLKEAREIEKRLKKLKRRDYIEKIIEEGYIRMTPRPR